MNRQEMQELCDQLQAARREFQDSAFVHPGHYSDAERKAAREKLRDLKERWDKRHSK